MVFLNHADSQKNNLDTCMLLASASYSMEWLHLIRFDILMRANQMNIVEEKKDKLELQMCIVSLRN